MTRLCDAVIQTDGKVIVAGKYYADAGSSGLAS